MDSFLLLRRLVAAIVFKGQTVSDYWWSRRTIFLTLLPVFEPEDLVSRDGFGSPVPRQPGHLHTQAESGASLRHSSLVPRRLSSMFLISTCAIVSVPSLSGYAIAYRWRSLPIMRRHRASNPPGSFERLLPWQVTVDQLIYASLSHTQYWYEVVIAC